MFLLEFVELCTCPAPQEVHLLVVVGDAPQRADHHLELVVLHHHRHLGIDLLYLALARVHVLRRSFLKSLVPIVCPRSHRPLSAPRSPRPARRCLVLEDRNHVPVLVVNVTVPPLVVLVQLDTLLGLVVDHPHKAAVCLVCLEQSIGIKDQHSETTKFVSRRDSYPVKLFN